MLMLPTKELRHNITNKANFKWKKTILNLGRYYIPIPLSTISAGTKLLSVFKQILLNLCYFLFVLTFS